MMEKKGPYHILNTGWDARRALEVISSGGSCSWVPLKHFVLSMYPSLRPTRQYHLLDDAHPVLSMHHPLSWFLTFIPSIYFTLHSMMADTCYVLLSCIFINISVSANGMSTISCLLSVAMVLNSAKTTKSIRMGALYTYRKSKCILDSGLCLVDCRQLQPTEKKP